MRNSPRCCWWLLALCLIAPPVFAQYYPGNYYEYDSGAGQGVATSADYYRGNRGGYHEQVDSNPHASLQYDERDAEAILREQHSRSRQYTDQTGQDSQMSPSIYENPYGHRLHDEGQVRQVMSEARNLSNVLKNRNGKPFIVIDKRNYQFYLYDNNGRLLRIGPVAIGKGKTDVGAFETPVGIFPIKSKIPVDDWVRPDWYFVEEGEPIPKRWEDRRVPGFFRYKLVYDGARYIHYAEATGGRLTHGCLGLDWHDAEAVFHTLQVGSHCIIMDQGFLARLARGEYPVTKPAVKPTKPEDGLPAVAARSETSRTGANAGSSGGGNEEKVLGNLW